MPSKKSRVGKVQESSDELIETMINRILKHVMEEEEEDGDELLTETEIAKLEESVADIERGNHTTPEHEKRVWAMT